MLHKYIKILIFITAGILLIFGSSVSAEQINKSEISLQEIIIKVLKKNPGLLPAKYEILSKDGEIFHQSRYSNTEFEVELENFAGNNELRGFRQAETTAVLRQEIPIGSKRSIMILQAKGEKKLLELLHKKNISDLVLETKKRFYKMFYLQEAIDLKKKKKHQAEQFLENISEKVKAGKISPAELSRARVYILRCDLDLRSVKTELVSSGIHLASLWGSSSFGFRKVILKHGTWESIGAPGKITEFPGKNPNLALLLGKIKQRETGLRLEKALKIPDITLSAGIKRHNDQGITAFTAGISVPLPVFNRNKGPVISAGHLVNKAKAEYEAEKVRLKTELKEKLKMVETMHINIKIIKEKIIPEIQNTFNIVTNGYLAGKFDYLNVLDVYNTSYDISEEYLRNIRDYRIGLAETDRLSGNFFENNLKKGVDND